ncbi:MAG: cobyric acid synthase [Halopenitus sp.]
MPDASGDESAAADVDRDTAPDRDAVPNARTILVAGTASHVGKSTVATGLCRLLADRGVDVAPFKGQNMSNNARAVPKATATKSESHDDGGEVAFGEIGVSQYVQARAARVRPSTDHNPVLLKPRGEGESQLVLDGEAVAHYAAGDYYEEHWDRARATAEAAHARLAVDHDVVVAEGAGSIAEINLQHRDIANVETARFADADIVLVADIERGGVFASLVGTLELLPDDLRERVAGAVITKFRGQAELLRPGIEEVENRTGVPVLGVVPYDDPGLPAEDSVDLPAAGERAVRGADDGVGADRSVTVAVPRLPHVSNFTDLEPLAAEPGVRVAYVPLDVDLAGPNAGGDADANVEADASVEADAAITADAIVLPGTKNTVDDLIAAREAGFDEELQGFEGPVVGLCGGYQLLGDRILRADVESASDDVGETNETGTSGTVDAFGLLPVETTFSERKRVVATELRLDGSGPLAGADGDVAGYEIHMGETRATDAADLSFPFAAVDGDGAGARNGNGAGARNGNGTGAGNEEGGRDGAALGAATDRVFGTYLHGLFENEVARDAFLEAVFAHAGRDRPATGTETGVGYDRAADLLREHVDLGPLDLDPLDGGDTDVGRN